tara:strand:- start:953 stop:1378 length:426 start_codon:yes stop_codon:yes gene_type:complete
MARHEGYSTWDSVNNRILMGPVPAPPADTTETWYATYIDFEANFNGILQEVVAVFDSDNSTITRSLAVKSYESDNSLLLEWVRTERNELLQSTDWTQVSDSPLEADKRTEWQLYRQRLRDLPASNGLAKTIDDISFPDPPT